MDATRERTHVLVVEANAADAQWVTGLLEGMFAWDAARSLPEAEAKIGRLRPRVVLVSDDWGETPTREFCRRVKTGPLRREVVVVTMTRGDPKLIQMVWGRQSGVDLHLRKPVEAKALHDCLRLCWQVLKSGEVAVATADDAPRPVAGTVEGASPSPPAASPESQTRLREILHMEINGDTLKKLFGGRRDQASSS